MRVFAIVTDGDGGDGVVENVINADVWPGGVDVTNVRPRPGPGWRYDGVAFSPPPDVPASQPATSPRMTHLYFLNRATAAERTTIRLARATDSTLDDAMYLFERSRDVDVSLPLTQQLVGYLAQQGYITAERAAALLAPAPAGEDGVL